MSEKLLFSLIFFVITFIFVILFYALFVNKKRKNMKTEGNFSEPSYLINRFKLNTRKIPYKNIMWTTTILNAFIISLVTAIVVNIDNLIFEILVGFVLLLGLTFVSYEILGRIYIKKGYAKKTKEEEDE